MSDRLKPHLAFIECVRGYAILLVITCHACYLFPGLPNPVHRVAVLGWHGVQLFFLASAVTLMMSWAYEKSRTGGVDVVAFFVRRLFRIAPAYYLASILYFVLEPPVGGFDLRQAAATFLFINTWHPVLMGVTPNAWPVVPGGWSIGVEFTFYAVFPVLASIITSLSRAVYLFFATLLVGAMVNSVFEPSLTSAFGWVPADNFLYFWFPNQMSVFALGLCLYFLLKRDYGIGSILARYPNSVAMLAVAIVAAVGFVVLPHWLSLRTPWPPAFLVVSLTMMLFILAVSRIRSGGFLNGGVALIGRVSFSAYLLHFAVLGMISRLPFMGAFWNSTGWSAIAAFVFALVCIVVIVVVISWCTYRLIETPMINLGKALIRQRRMPVPQNTF